MEEAKAHPYFNKYQKMRQKERETFMGPNQTLIGLICWDIYLAWFKMRTGNLERDFIEKFGMQPLFCY